LVAARAEFEGLPVAARAEVLDAALEPVPGLRLDLTLPVLCAPFGRVRLAVRPLREPPALGRNWSVGGRPTT
jgi:hypothetical protein